MSAVTNGVQRVIDLGIADPARIGITGLSDGASTVAFALINTDRFAAAAMSSCCIEPWTVMTVVGPAYADRMRALGYPCGHGVGSILLGTGLDRPECGGD